MSGEELAVIGKKVPKYDSIDKATGQVQYANDISLRGMLHGKILRSPVPHARILDIDTRRAARLPGVKAILTGKDVPQTGFGVEREFNPQGGDQRALQATKVRYIGDEIAAVAAVDEDTALEALELIKVEFEELPAVFDPEEAMVPGAPEVHEGVRNNISYHFPLLYGDPEAWKEADCIVEERFSTQMQNACVIGPRCVVAKFDPAGNLTVWRDTQMPFYYRAELGHVLGIDPKKINIIRTAIGGAFGSKLDMQAFDPTCALLAKEAGRPVRIAYTREEEFCAHPRHPCIYYLKTGAKKDGTLVGREARVIVDNGAYNATGPSIPLAAVNSVAALYRVPYAKFDAYVVYTNKPFGSAVQGFGDPQAIFAVEQQIDMLAERLGMDPVELRLKNVNRPNSKTINGLKITSCGLEQCIRRSADAAGWFEKRGKQSAKKRGMGMGCFMNTGGASRSFGIPGVGLDDGSGSIIKVDDFGKVVVTSGATDLGQGSDTVIAQIAAETLGVAYEDVTLHKPDTDSAPFDMGSEASRTTFAAGNATRLAALDAKRQILDLASDLLEVSPTDLDIKDRQVFVTSYPGRSMSLVEVLQRSHFNFGNEGKVVTGSAFYQPPSDVLDPVTMAGNVSAAYGFSAQVAEVEVDVETGRVTVLNYVAARDLGRVINPLGADGLTHGGVALGMGYALGEDNLFTDGKVANAQFLDYKVPTALEMPPIRSIYVETDDPQGPYGAKGMGHSAPTGVAAAIANAVYDAIGVRLRDLPITPEKILKALDAKGRKD